MVPTTGPWALHPFYGGLFPSPNRESWQLRPTEPPLRKQVGVKGLCERGVITEIYQDKWTPGEQETAGKLTCLLDGGLVGPVETEGAAPGCRDPKIRFGEVWGAKESLYIQNDDGPPALFGKVFIVLHFQAHQLASGLINSCMHGLLTSPKKLGFGPKSWELIGSLLGVP
ncbi:hypothetical protein DSO57_1021989 [Entomophthora muscae]|uniref:Uncharacterized protein n=1 Tax=Entomophthora muscae TaxID=34485 RepID=A0ACC2T3R5_9FUNG|nr:hypothetical protein DSO57_1021989 [Entomophthora muscae]